MAETELLEFYRLPTADKLTRLSGSLDRDWARSVLDAKTDNTGTRWRSRALATDKVVRGWAASSARRLRGYEHRESGRARQNIERFRFPAGLRDCDASVQAECWDALRGQFISTLRQGLLVGLEFEEVLTSLLAASRDAQTGNSRVASYVKSMLGDSKGSALYDIFPPLCADVLVFKLDDSYKDSKFGSDSVQSEWDACKQRHADEDPLTLSLRVTNAFLQKRNSNELDSDNVWNEKSHAFEINTRFAECLLNDEAWPARGALNYEFFNTEWQYVEALIDAGQCNVSARSCINLARLKVVPKEFAATKGQHATLQSPSGAARKSLRVPPAPPQSQPRQRIAGSVQTSPNPEPSPKTVAALSHPAPSAPPAAPPPFTRVLGKAPDAGRTQNAVADGRGRGAPNRPSGRSGATPAPRALSAAPVSGASSLPPPPPASELAGAHNTEPPPRNQSRRYCDPPANGLGKPAGLTAGDWTTADWQNHSTIDIRKLDSLATTAAVVATAKVRPTDSSMTSARVGDVRALDVSVTPAVWAPGSCAYCAFRPRAPAHIPVGHPDNWWYGHGEGDHNPTRCFSAKRYLAEGGDLDNEPQFAQHLRACLRTDFKSQQRK